ncbi:DUF2252 family protein [Solimicrobium silvestre]|uniref:DUF2252 domain-containing protein n=1 Tax=Solimicrobium silvestre TaxID=2099400 RepID=A0A2S9GZ58_9BURK|nr:DUF2252 family protein [Solimicrobium silvestre]PRC93011.1 hypothetical protein S2091_2428 [Solimicrobium silvestre]
MKKSQRQLLEPDQRLLFLRAQRNLKMARSVQSYVRGSTTKFYEWLETSSSGKFPEGPAIWICGDCHFGNLGPVANADGQVEVQIRDFDQTVIGNPIHDLIRLGLSLAIAARDSDLPGVITLKMLEQLMEGYAQEFHDETLTMPRPECVKLVMRQASTSKWKNFAKQNLDNLDPSIPLGKRFWPISQSESLAITKMFGDKEFSGLATRLRARNDDAVVTVLDAAYWRKGCSSLGNLRYAALLDIDQEVSKGRDFCLMDIKQAIKALAPRAFDAKMPRDNGKRVLEGALQLSPYLGERMLASQLMGCSVFIRELLPQDLKLEVNKLTQLEAMIAAKYLGSIVGKAHARQMDAGTRSKWCGELLRNQTKKFELPDWLWNSVVELIATHESSYLEHCRTYVMDTEFSEHKIE